MSVAGSLARLRWPFALSILAARGIAAQAGWWTRGAGNAPATQDDLERLGLFGRVPRLF